MHAKKEKDLLSVFDSAQSFIKHAGRLNGYVNFPKRINCEGGGAETSVCVTVGSGMCLLGSWIFTEVSVHVAIEM